MVPVFPQQDDSHGCNVTGVGVGVKCGGGGGGGNTGGGNTFTRRRRRCFSCATDLQQQAAPGPPPSTIIDEPESTATAVPPCLHPPAAKTTAGLPFMDTSRSSTSVSVTAAAAAAVPVSAGKGSLTSRVSAAVTAVIFATAAASMPMGVGAMTESQCENATLLGTEAVLTETPRLDTSTEAAAAGLDQTIVASQETYDRMISDQLAISAVDGRDLPFKNAWSDHTWFGEVELTFSGAAALAELEEELHPEFQCMNDYYGLTLETGVAAETTAAGTLTTDRVLNWDLLKPLYEEIKGLDSFVPRDVTTLPPTLFLVAAKEEVASEELTPDFHYFLSEPAADMDPSICPEPCYEQVVTYYWSSSADSVYHLATADVSVEPRPCWLDLFDAVADGPPSGGVDSSVWESTLLCTAELLDDVEEAVNNGEVSPAQNSSSGGGGGGSEDTGSSDATVVAAAAVIIPAALFSFAVIAFGLLRHQKGRRLKKMKTTDEAWGEGLDGSGGDVTKKVQPPPAPPTGKFKLGAAAVADNMESGIGRKKSFPPPRRVFTDVSIDEEAGGGGGGSPGMEGVGGKQQQQQQQQQHGGGGAVEAMSGDDGEEEDEDMIYPM